MQLRKDIVAEDVKTVWAHLSQEEKDRLRGRDILITGFAGSLGYMVMEFFRAYAEELAVGHIYCIDNYSFGRPDWVDGFLGDGRFRIRRADIATCDLRFAAGAKIILHMASLASPVYYRQHPIETIDADVIGLRNLLDFYRDREIGSLVFFSTSEVYGDPAPGRVPTSEAYWGNVNTSGPRACYDESKRFGETLCYNYSRRFGMPVTVIRPFNSFGPGLRTNDQRVVADFAKNVVRGEDIVIFSDGRATRTFCYSADTTVGILKCAAFGQYGIFNIGNDRDEMSIAQLAELYRKVGRRLFRYGGNIVYRTHPDRDYLTDNPKRRCPDIGKAERMLGYRPVYSAETGIERYLLSLT